MQSKFNFYDFVGYIIPGSLVLVLLYWFSLGFASFKIPVEVKSFGESLLFFIAGYFVGHLMQAMGNVIEKKQVNKWGGWFSEQFLRDDDTHYSGEFKTELKDCILKKFKISFDGSIEDEEVKKRKRQELFNLCYSFIIQENAASHTEIFNGIYSLYRGLLASVWIGSFVSGLIILKHFVLRILICLNINLPSGKFYKFELIHFILGIIFLICFVLSIFPLESRFKRFAKRFADSVYRNYYVWCVRNPEKKNIFGDND